MTEITRIQEAKTSNDLTKAIKVEAAKNPVFSAVCHIFALRERARQEITMSRLMYATAKEGYSFTKQQHADVLKFLASIGIGKLDIDARGNIKALRGIRVTLQSIGMAGVGDKVDLAKFEPSVKFNSIVPPKFSNGVGAVHVPVPPPQTPRGAPRHAANFTVFMDGKPVVFEVPKGVTTQELVNVLSAIFSADK